jgi:hypothetical protein
MTLLEFGEAQIKLNSRQLWIQGKSLPVGGGSLGILLLFGIVDSQAGVGSGITGVAGDDGQPDAFSASELALLLKGDSVLRPGIGGLSRCEGRSNYKDSEEREVAECGEKTG